MSKVAIQKPAPGFSAQALVNGEFKQLSLGDFKGKYLVLFFYPLDWTFVCPTEIIAFSDRAAEFRKMGAEVVGCSVDSKFSHFNWVNQPRKMGGLGHMDIPLLSDITKQIARDYGCLLETGDDAGLACRATFIIDKAQNMRVVMMNDLPIGRSVDEVMRLLEALQFNEIHGDVCPAGWKKGALSMKEDVHESKKYFEKVTSLCSMTTGKLKANDPNSPDFKRLKIDK